MEFLGTFTKSLKAPIIFVMSVLLSVCLPACTNKWPTGQVFLTFNTGDIFFKSVDKNRNRLIWDKKSGNLREELSPFYIVDSHVCSSTIQREFIVMF
jgi:hypothetical protein